MYFLSAIKIFSKFMNVLTVLIRACITVFIYQQCICATKSFKTFHYKAINYYSGLSCIIPLQFKDALGAGLGGCLAVTAGLE